MSFWQGVAGLIILLLVCAGSSVKKPQRYAIEETNDNRFFIVVETATEETVFIGTLEQCEQWIKEHE